MNIHTIKHFISDFKRETHFLIVSKHSVRVVKKGIACDFCVFCVHLIKIETKLG